MATTYKKGTGLIKESCKTGKILTKDKPKPSSKK